MSSFHCETSFRPFPKICHDWTKNLAVERGCHFFHHGLHWLLSPHLGIGETPEVVIKLKGCKAERQPRMLPLVRDHWATDRGTLHWESWWQRLWNGHMHHPAAATTASVRHALLTPGHTFTTGRYDAPVTVGGWCASSIHRSLNIESLTIAAQTSPNRLTCRWRAHGFGIRWLLVTFNLRMKRPRRTVVL